MIGEHILGDYFRQAISQSLGFSPCKQVAVPSPVIRLVVDTTGRLVH